MKTNKMTAFRLAALVPAVLLAACVADDFEIDSAQLASTDSGYDLALDPAVDEVPAEEETVGIDPCAPDADGNVPPECWETDSCVEEDYSIPCAEDEIEVDGLCYSLSSSGCAEDEVWYEDVCFPLDWIECYIGELAEDGYCYEEVPDCNADPFLANDPNKKKKARVGKGRLKTFVGIVSQGVRGEVNNWLKKLNQALHKHGRRANRADVDAMNSELVKVKKTIVVNGQVVKVHYQVDTKVENHPGDHVGDHVHAVAHHDDGPNAGTKVFSGDPNKPEVRLTVHIKCDPPDTTGHLP